MRKLTLLLTTILVMGYMIPILPQFNTSLHTTRNGKPYFYNKVENGGSGGFETLTNVPISGLGCVQCHGATDANGNAYPTPYVPGGCNECHATNTPPFPGPVAQANCLKCHGREAAVINLGLPDVHRTAGKSCNFCHKANDVHGNGTNYNSMFEPGAIATDCANAGCHPALPTSHAANDPHNGKIHCTSCHAKTNLACYNCHFESVVSTSNNLRRAQRQITNFVFLVNRTKDNKVHPASYQSLSYQGQTWITFGPSSAHTIVKTGARVCVDCHQNLGGNIPAIVDYNADGIMKIGTWNTADSTLSWLQGVIPIPFDWKTSIKLDYITYNGNTSDPVVPSKNWSKIDDVTDGSHMLFATPLSSTQMSKLGMEYVVPVELTSFTGSAVDLNVKLNWSTATELNNNGFEIQRKSGNEFVTIGFVKGNGTTTSSHDYGFVDRQLTPGKYSYRLKQLDYNGKYEYSAVIDVQVVLGLKFALLQNYPNPFNPETSIKYSIAQDGKVAVKIYNVTGKEIMILVDQDMLAGSYEVKWNGKDISGSTVSAGVYFVKLSSGRFVETRKIMFLK